MKGHEYFAMLNEVEQKQFIENFKNCRLMGDSLNDLLEEDYSDFDSFISSSFLFNKTPEGAEYWHGIRDSQRDGVDASGRRKSPKSMSEFMEKLMFLAFMDSVVELDSDKPSESLEDVLSSLKVKLSDEK